MAETKWTEGPWTYDAGVVWAGELTIADVLDTTEGYEGCDPQIKPNGQLLAAAPELYAALDALMPMIDEAKWRAEEPLVAAAYAAMAKARGQS